MGQQTLGVGLQCDIGAVRTELHQGVPNIPMGERRRYFRLRLLLLVAC